MGILDFLKPAKYNLNESDVARKLEGAVIPKKEEALPEKPVKATAPLLHNLFVVESSFKMPPYFVLSGLVVKGQVRKGMATFFGDEKVVIKGLQFQFKKTGALKENEKGSLEVAAKLGMEIPDGTTLRFAAQKDLPKQKKKKPKKASKKSKVRLQKALANFQKEVVKPNREHAFEKTGLSDSADSVIDDLASQ